MTRVMTEKDKQNRDLASGWDEMEKKNQGLMGKKGIGPREILSVKPGG